MQEAEEMPVVEKTTEETTTEAPVVEEIAPEMTDEPKEVIVDTEESVEE